MILFACEMPLEANILIESGSGKESVTPGQARGDRLRKEQSDADLRQHDNRGDVSMTIGYGPYRLRLQGDDNRGRCGVLPAEGVESNGVRTRGIPPPPLKECFILKHDFQAPERGFFAPKNVSLLNKLGVFRIWHGVW